MRRQGRIVDWNDARGFGFVQWHGGDERVFAHISAFERGARPSVGDVVTYEVVPGDRGPKASDIRYAGAARAARRAAPASATTVSSVVRGLVTAALLAVVAMTGWRYVASRLDAPVAMVSAASNRLDAEPAAAPAFQCTGKQHCSQMTSRAEAEFYIAHCPNTLMDGDRDGVPCEDQWR